MEELLKYLVANITGISDVQIEKEGDTSVNYLIKVPQESIGLVIGKGGKTIKLIRNLAKVKATLENQKVNVSVVES